MFLDYQNMLVRRNVISLVTGLFDSLLLRSYSWGREFWIRILSTNINNPHPHPNNDDSIIFANSSSLLMALFLSLFHLTQRSVKDDMFVFITINQ